MNQNKKSNFHTLYLCYFGLREPLVQTQVLPYLRQIISNKLKVSLLTFESNFKEKWSDAEIQIQKKQLASEGISWYCLPYHKSPSVPATILDVMNGARFTVKLAKKETVDIFHCRSYVAAMMGAIAKLRCGGKLLFDIRGFFADEYTDAGNWKENGKIYKAVKRAEKYLLKKSDGFVVLTEKAREILFPESRESGFDKNGRPIEVIPCCVDTKRFAVANEESRRRMRQKLNLENRFVIVYIGSFGGFYMAKETADFYGMAKQKHANTFALILTQTSPEMIQPLLEARGYTEKDFFIQKVSPAEIPLYLSAADIAVSFIKPCYSKLSSSPTKNAEYLASGLPMLANSGVGDTTEMTREDNVGVIIDEFSIESYQSALTNLDKLLKSKNELTQRCKNSAKKRFDLETVGGERYRNLYRKLLK